MGMFSNDEQASWSDVYEESNKRQKIEDKCLRLGRSLQLIKKMLIIKTSEEAVITFINGILEEEFDKK